VYQFRNLGGERAIFVSLLSKETGSLAENAVNCTSKLRQSEKTDTWAQLPQYATVI
jgi:hypothetical protein